MTQVVLPATTFGRGYVEGEVQEALTRLMTTEAASPPDSMPVNSWIAVMSPHVKETTKNGKRTFSVESSAREAVGPGHAQIAELLCGYANAMRLDPGTAESAAHVESFGAGDHGTYVAYWWGYKLTMNGQLTNDVLALIGFGAAASAIAAAVTSAVPAAAAVLGVLAGVLGLYVTALTWAMGHCNNAGAVINACWASLATPWVTAVC